MTRWRIDLEYCGTDFAGWQVQPGQRTVQGSVEQALASILQHPVRVGGAGRTDSGVHALQQVASFVTDVEREPKSIQGGLNAELPWDVACVAAARVPENFDPRRAPHTKRYVYTWLDRNARSPMLRDRAWHVRQRLDVQAMARAAELVVGSHDFSSFRAARCSSTHALRTIEHAEVLREGDRVIFAIHGTGFLRHMVRIMAGVLHEVGRGTQPSSWMGEVIDAQDRQAASRTAPPGGLCLEWIRYKSGSIE